MILQIFQYSVFLNKCHSEQSAPCMRSHQFASTAKTTRTKWQINFFRQNLLTYETIQYKISYQFQQLFWFHCQNKVCLLPEYSHCNTNWDKYCCMWCLYTHLYSRISFCFFFPFCIVIFHVLFLYRGFTPSYLSWRWIFAVCLFVLIKFIITHQQCSYKHLQINCWTVCLDIFFY